MLICGKEERMMSNQFNPEVYDDNAKNIKRIIDCYYKTQLFQYATPLTLSFLVTDRCNLRCKHCFNHWTRNTDIGKKKGELTIDEIEKLTKSMGFMLNTLICGGEPFLRDDLHEIVRLLRVNNKAQGMSSSTNGQDTGKIVEQMRKISAFSPYSKYSMNFSLEGFEEENDEVRGKGTFQNALRTWNECRKLNQEYGNIIQNVVITMNSINQTTLPRFFEWVNETMKPNRIMLLLVRQSPRGGEYLKDVNPANYKIATDLLNKYTLEGIYGDCNVPTTFIPAAQYYYCNEGLRTGRRSYMCYAGQHGAFINYDGEVNVCEVFGDSRCNENAISMGNLRDYNMNFIELWNSEKAMEIRQQVNRNKICENCTHETEGILPSIYFEPNFYGIDSIKKQF